MPAWLQRDWCSSFVLALGHFLWQGTLIAVVLSLALRATKAVSVRYWLSLAALLVMAACPVVTLGWLMQPVSPVATLDTPFAVEAPAPNQPMISAAPAEEASDVGQVSNLPVIPSAPPVEINPDPSGRSPNLQPATDDRSWWQKFAPQLTTAYLCGVALMLLRLVAGLWGGRRLRRRVHLIDDPSLLVAMRRQATALGLKLLPVLAYCERVTVPTVVGVLKPMILLPLTLTSGLSLEQIESVLAHELAHLRRYDHLVNLLQRVIESLLFFHPALWWVSHRIRDEREHCCDDLVVACGAMPLDYAKSLLRVAELSRASPLRRSVAAVSLLATGHQKPSNLRQRIARLLGESATPSLRVSPRALLVSICIPLIAVIATIQSGASNQQPSRSDKDEPSQATEFSTKLRNGVTVKLVGVGFHPSEKREWWQADGSPLDKRPYEKFAGNPLYQDESRLADCREFALEIRGLPQDHFVMTRIDGGPKVGSVVLNELKEGVFFTKLKAGPFADEKTTSLVVGLSVDPLGPAQRIGPDGRKLAAVAMPQDAKLLDDLIQPLRVQSRDGGTVLVLKPLAPFLLYQKAEWRLVAVDSDGQETTSNSQNESAQELELGFKLPLARLARFEYRLRPLRHWVTFENVSLVPGRQTDVKVRVESLPDEKSRAGRGSPDPALDPTAGLPNSDEETNPPNNDNGDLRSKPAAGSGDPRRAHDPRRAQLNRVVSLKPSDRPRELADVLKEVCRQAEVEFEIDDAELQKGRYLQSMPMIVDEEGVRGPLGFVLSQVLNPALAFELVDQKLRVSTRLKLKGSRFEAEHIDLAKLAELAGPTLTSLRLCSTRATDDDLRHLAKFPKLERLDLTSTAIGDAGMEHVARLESLTTLRLGDFVTDAGLKTLTASRSIRTLVLIKSPVTDAAAESLVRMLALETLVIQWANFGNAGVKRLAEADRLKRLVLYARTITDEGTASLVSCRKLETLSLLGERLTVGSLKPLEKMRSLRELEIGFPDVTESDVKPLRTALAKTRIRQSPTAPPDPSSADGHVFDADTGRILETFRSQFGHPDPVTGEIEWEPLREQYLAPNVTGSFGVSRLQTFRKFRVIADGYEPVEITSLLLPGDDPRNHEMKIKMRRATKNVAAPKPPDGLEFLKPYPKLHGLSLDMTEPQFLEIVKQQELKTHNKSVDGEKVTHRITLGDGHTLIVMFDKDGKCSGIQRVRGDDAPAIDPAKELAAFQGTWCWDFSQPWTWPQPIGVGTDGNGRKSEKRWVVKGNQITWISQEGRRINVNFTIDPTKTPKQIDFTFLNGPHKGRKSIGIYESKGAEDHRWLCMTDPGTDAPRPIDISAGTLKQQSMISIYRVAPPEKPSVAKALERLQGVWQMELCDSTTETFGGTQQEVSKWQWTIKGDEILWSRQDRLWKMKFEVDPTKSPNAIDITYLVGPFKGKKCQGMYVFGGVDGQTLMLSIQDPGSQAPRPTDISMRGDVMTSLIFLRPSDPSDAERELGSFQGTWTLKNFDTGDEKKDPHSWPLPGGKRPDASGEGSELRWTVKGNEITWTSPSGEEIKASFTIDSRKSPKQIDLTFLSGPHKGETCPGIYQRGDLDPGLYQRGDLLDENMLWLCIADPKSKTARPKNFSNGEGRSLMSFYPSSPESP